MNDKDLHIHSNYSDGSYSPIELIPLLKENNIKTFAICDHDTIGSLKELKKLDLDGLEYISGIEISSYYKDMGIHILGYYIDGNIIPLKKLLKKIEQKRKKRMKEILKKIKEKHGIKITHQELFDLMHTPNVGKKNLGKILLNKNLGKDYLDIRTNYLTGLHCKTSYRSNIKTVCKVIKQANGIPVLAHPKEYEMRFNIKIEDVIVDMIACGIEGIEVYHSIHDAKDIERYLKIARKYNLKISGGSDFHNGNAYKLGVLHHSDTEVTYQKFTVIKD